MNNSLRKCGFLMLKRGGKAPKISYNCIKELLRLAAPNIRRMKE